MPTRIRLVTACAALALAAWGCRNMTPSPSAPAKPAEAAKPALPAASPERGRYVLLTGGCNDCHTPGFMQAGLAVPESLWFTGVPVGWRGPWGTTYGSNLRLFVKDMDEQTFIAVAHTRDTRPPMPWTALHSMTDDDLRSVHRYLKKLGPAGFAAPAYVPPGEDPKGPYIDVSVKLPGGAPAPAKP